MELKELDKQIKSGTLKNFYFFYGEEQFLIGNRIKSIKRRVLSPEFISMNYTVFEGKGVSVENVISEIETFPVMSDRRIVVIKNTGILNNSKLTEYKRFKSYVPHIPDYAIVIMVEGVIDKKKVKSYEWISEYGGLSEFKLLSVRELELWLERWFEDENRRILDRDINYFVRTVGQNMSVLYNEAVKVMEYTAGRSKITRKDIDEIVVKSTDFIVFDMINDIIENRASRVMEQLKLFKEKRESGVAILTILTNKLSEILMVKHLKEAGLSAAEIAKYFEITRPVFAINKIYEQSRGFGERYLLRMIKKGFEYDVQIKSGMIAEWTAVNMFATELIKK